MTEMPAGISDEAVASATGHDWEHWLDVLDDRDAVELGHKEIVAELDDAGVESAWWRQTIANAYEVERGMRETGETADAGFQVGVQRTLPASSDALWELLCSAEGRRLWLGHGASFAPEPGTTYETDDGTAGEVRTVKDGERIRMTWQPADRDAPTTLQLTLSSRGDAGKTTLRVHHEKLSGQDEREEMRAHWRSVLDRIDAGLSSNTG